MPESIDFHTTEVDLSGLLTVLGSNLYSSPEVAVRELVQNAHDACLRRRIETGQDAPAEIRVGANPDQGRIWIEDTGAGLTADEMRRYLATIGAGYTRVLRQADQTDDTGLIGAFGLGFLSAYMVGRRVEVVSTSASSPDIGTLFRSDSGRTYVLQAVAPRAIGSRVEIELKADLADLAKFPVLARLLRHHCRLLSVPVVLDWSGEVVNDISAPWRTADAGLPAIRLRKDRLAFAEQFESVFTPVAALPLSAGEGDRGGGLVWIHDGSAYGSIDNRAMSVFVNGMRVCDNERDLLPPWAGFISGVYESARLVPTTSREDVKKDEAYFAVRRRIAADLAQGLATLPKDDPEAWRRVLRRHNEALLGAAIADDGLFDAVRDELQVPTSAGDLKLRDILERSGGRVCVSVSDEDGADGVLARTLGAPVINGMRYGAFAFARKWAQAEGIELTDVGSRRGLDALLPETTVADADRAALEAWFGEGARVRPTCFSPASLPLLVMIDQEARTKAMLESDQADARLSSGVLAMARLFTQTVDKRPERIVAVNMDCPAVKAALALKGTTRGDAAAGILRALADILTRQGNASGGTALQDSLDMFSKALMALLGEAE